MGIKNSTDKMPIKQKIRNKTIIQENSQNKIKIEWLNRYIKPRTTEPPLPIVPVAPVGISVYGVKRDGSVFALSTNAVRGEVEISPDVQTLGYNYNSRSYERAFSVQLNVHVASKLKNGTTQYYWIQSTIGIKESHAHVQSHVWNLNDLQPTVFGNGVNYGSNYGEFYRHFRELDLLEHNTLEVEVYVDRGGIIIDFHVNGEMYDEALIMPHIPADSAHIVAAPTALRDGSPLNLELIFGGYGHLTPWAILRSGQIGLKLYIRERSEWVPPPSAWSIGYATYEAAHAYVIPRGIGSVLVAPGEPNPRPLW